MKKTYKVTVHIESKFDVEVDAENEREAINKAESFSEVELNHDAIIRDCLIQFGDSECEEVED